MKRGASAPVLGEGHGGLPAPKPSPWIKAKKKKMKEEEKDTGENEKKVAQPKTPDELLEQGPMSYEAIRALSKSDVDAYQKMIADAKAHPLLNEHVAFVREEIGPEVTFTIFDEDGDPAADLAAWCG